MTTKAKLLATGSAAATIIGVTPPASPIEGQMWYDTTDGTLYIRTGALWIEAIVAAAGAPGPTGATGAAGAAGAAANPLPSGTTAQRPSPPVIGNMRINTELGVLELYNGTGWTTLNVLSFISATGGTITYSGNYAIHTFNSSGTFTVTTVPSGSTVEYLLIGGGGSGGGSTGGGGGAGGYLTNASLSVSATTYSIVIGAGAAGRLEQTAGTDGTNSTAFGLTAIGGGGGGYSYSGGGGATGRAGGSGGGGESYTAGYASGGAGTAGQGNAGGSGSGASSGGSSGGGGGASAVGGNGSGTSTGGNGGDGLPSSITGASIYRAGGGGAGASTTGGTGGTGGGGVGGVGTGAGTAGTANTGSGGGGGYNYTGGAGGAGGSGVVIIRYRYQ